MESDYKSAKQAGSNKLQQQIEKPAWIMASFRVDWLALYVRHKMRRSNSIQFLQEIIRKNTNSDNSIQFVQNELCFILFWFEKNKSLEFQRDEHPEKAGYFVISN